jgi:hypothetical protein
MGRLNHGWALGLAATAGPNEDQHDQQSDTEGNENGYEREGLGRSKRDSHGARLG